MWEIKFYSRGGQGAVTAAKILVNAAILDGKYAQAIPSYGQERKGAPVFTYARISDQPIDIKSYVCRPNCVIDFDPSLKDVGIDSADGIRPHGYLVVNTNQSDYSNEAFESVTKIDADRITHELLGEAPPNIAMLGALIKATHCVSLDSLQKAVKMKVPGKAGEINAKACTRAYEDA